MESFIDMMKKVTILLLVIGMAAYGLILLLFAFGIPGAVELVKGWPSHAFDIPMAAIAAFGVVSFLERPKTTINEDGSKTTNDLEFKAFSLEFTGPAVPATLWVVVFLSIMISFTL
ncbi:MAG: hypothetical protein AAF151_12160 [Cyanobacteria bacterium J06656_5]